MPYSGINDKSLPSYVNKLRDSLKSKWISIFNATYKISGEEKALIVANTWLKKQLTKKAVVAKTQTKVERLFFEVDMSEGFIKRTADGDDYIDFVLTDNKPDTEGIKYDVGLLKKWADKINDGANIIGDIDHSEYDKVLAGGYSKDEIVSLLKGKKGIARGIKAIVEKGRLWVRALIDKRYKKQMQERAKGVSLEALLTYDEANNVVDGELLGFTFAVNDKPANPRAVVA